MRHSVLFAFCLVSFVASHFTLAWAQAWRNDAEWTRPEFVDLSPAFPPARDQGNRMTSAAFAATSLMEYLYRAKSRDSLILSEEWAYAAGRALALADPNLKPQYQYKDRLSGEFAVRAYEIGAVEAKDWPYQEHRTPGDRISRIKPDSAPIRTPHLKLETVGYRGLIKWLLEEQTPIVFDVFWFFGGSDQGVLKMPSDEDILACLASLAGCQPHSILLVGFDANTREFFFRNSKGPDWGDGGYGRVSEAYLKRLAVDKMGRGFSGRWVR